ncbi:class I adenylate-forming enzyme family protein [Pseudorhodoferax soli]|nr:class I adenylate-forming enzyme family protein [Pseudorhodoferax soli]
MEARHTTLIQAFHDLWSSAGRRECVAIRTDEEALTYGALHQEVGQLSHALRARGVQEGDRVAIAMDRSVLQCELLLAVLACGACPCVLEPKLGAEELRRRFAAARLTWLIADESNADANAGPNLEDGHVIDAASLEPGESVWWSTGTDPMQPAFLLFTSGSSGKPKGVLQSHLGLLVNAKGVAQHSKLSGEDVLLHLMPLFHTNGVNNQLLAPLLVGASIALAGRFKAEDVPRLFDRFRPSIVTGVPTMYSRLLGQEFSNAALSKIRMLRCGSAPITQELQRRVEEKFGTPLVISYGLSEATCTSTMNPPLARRLGTVGTVLEGQDVFLADDKGRRITEAGRDGEICIAGPSLMLGYLLDGSAGIPAPVEGGVLRTGDLGRFDEDGYLAITGRIKDVIIRGGENLSPNLIESVLTKVEGVQACCVVGRRDEDLGEVPVAFVVRSKTSAGEQLAPAAMTAAVVTELSRIHQPVEYHFVADLPENAVGKVDRKALAQRLEAARQVSEASS